jgi:hypothetical protein
MSNIGQLMAHCPLKQFIRENLWEKYVKKLNKKPIKYFTFYAPTIMDIKHFCKRGYVKFEDNVYKDVASITNNEEEGYAAIISEGAGRPEILRIGEAHKLISTRDREFISKFPFDVINLDYCNYIFGDNVSPYLSGNLKDIKLILERQKKANSEEFILFVTSRTDRTKKAKAGKGDRIGFASNFIDELITRINVNLAKNLEFREKFRSLFPSKSIESVIKESYSEFISIGIMKLISMSLASYKYEIVDCESAWLTRDAKEPVEDLLHVAFHVKKGKVKRHGGKGLSEFGSETFYYLESGVVKVLDQIISGTVIALTEQKDYKVLNDKLGPYIEELREETFELPVPEPANSEED